ncbi:MAG: hypothetical protein ACK5PQ_02490 [Alphaproteobacteria bacterium]
MKRLAKKDEQELERALLTKQMVTLEDRKAHEDAYFSTELRGEIPKEKWEKSGQERGGDRRAPFFLG